MKIKTKLVIALCIIIFVPIGLICFSLVGFQWIQKQAIERTYGIKKVESASLTNPVRLLDQMTEEVFKELQIVRVRAVAKFEDEAFLEEINTALQEKHSYLVVRKGNEIVYTGKDMTVSDVDLLPHYGETDKSTGTGIHLESQKDMLMKQVDFQYKDGTEGSAFIITSTKEAIPEIKGLMIELAISGVFILFITAFMMYGWLYRSMIHPIRRLQTAAENIREGNLDFEINTEGTDEIGDLCVTFEKMRKRLKDNAEEKLRNEQKNRELISNIAHDLKTPITAVKGYSEGIIDGVANTPEKIDKYVRTIYSKANEMDRLINELTLYSKIDANRIPYNFAKLNVMDYFNDCVEEIGLELEAKDIGLSCYNYVESDVMIIADPEQLRRVINNIVGNCVKYMDKQKGVLNIRVKDVGDFIQVEIEDNGRGIAQKDLPYIFDRFYRTDASRNSATGGSGIGLSIVKKIIEDHGGNIWATSKEGTGTIMYFVIRKYQEVINE